MAVRRLGPRRVIRQESCSQLAGVPRVFAGFPRGLAFPDAEEAPGGAADLVFLVGVTGLEPVTPAV